MTAPYRRRYKRHPDRCDRMHLCVTLVGVATKGTGVGGITVCCTGRSGDSRAIAVCAKLGRIGFRGVGGACAIHRIEMREVIGAGNLRGDKNGEGGIGTVSTHIADLTVEGGLEGVLPGVPSVNGACRVGKGKVIM